MSHKIKLVESGLFDFLQNVYALKTLIRYNTTPRLQNESVAEHLAFTGLIVLKLYETFEFDLQRTMLMALTHDIPEIYTSDVPHPVKRSFPALAKALREVERFAWENFNEQWRVANDEMEEGVSLEAVIVQLADILSCVQYASSEVALGNTHMLAIKQSSMERMHFLLNKLDKEFPHAYRHI